MLKIIIPFTNEIVFNSDDHTDNQSDELVINQFDEVRETIELNVKSFQVEDIAVYMISMKCPESVLITAKVNKHVWLMNFTLAGRFYMQQAGTDIDITLTEKTHYSLIPPVDEQVDLVIKGYVNLFVVCIAAGTVKNLLTNEEEVILQQRMGNGQDWLSGRITTPAMANIINTMLRCMEDNHLHRILLAAKMLELLFLDLEQLNNTIERSALPSIRSNDLEKLKLAKTLIAEDLQSPCSLIELAHKVGLNDFKLKKGFKEAFGTTVFGHLFNLRMEKAKAMLTTSKYTVSEVAHEVGYKNAHHFTVAFKKNFGYLPSKILDN